MLPKATVPEGSRMVLDGVEFWIIHNFTTERGNVYETTGGEFIFPNGKAVNDRSLLEILPDQHVERALTWFDRRFEGGGEKGEDVDLRKRGETPPAGRPMTKAELLAKARFIMEQAEMMEDEEAPEVPPRPPESVEEEGPTSGQVGQPKDTKESKSPSRKSKADRETDVLSQMGIKS